MTRLSDTQCILLSAASQRSNGSLLPLPTTLRPGPGTASAIAALLRHGLAVERQTLEVAAARRSEGDLRYGVFITSAGSAAIGVEPDQSDTTAPDTTAPDSGAALAPTTASATRPHSKTATVVALLGRETGATTAELVEATGWLPHTMRAALTGLRRKGHEISRGKRDGATCYRITGAA